MVKGVLNKNVGASSNCVDNKPFKTAYGKACPSMADVDCSVRMHNPYMGADGHKYYTAGELEAADKIYNSYGPLKPKGRR